MTQISKILFVDDEERILDAIRRNLRRQTLAIHTATTPQAALDTLDASPGFAVVVSDMRMPSMDGVQFLSRVKERHPDVVRVMLTGNADIATAIEAINHGSIFRFITKPSPPDILLKAVEDCIAQHLLITAERQLLEDTLKGCVNVLVDILSLSNPAAFGKAMRLKHYVSHCAARLGVPGAWLYEVSALLSQIGYITVPQETLEREASGAALSDAETRMVSAHAQVARNLIVNIPRMEIAAEIVASQASPSAPSSKFSLADQPQIIGAHLLRAAIEMDKWIVHGLDVSGAVHRMTVESAVPELLANSMLDLERPAGQSAAQLVPVSDVRRGMILAEDIKGSNGMLIVGKGQEVSEIMRKRLENFHRQGVVSDMVSVVVYA